MTFLSTLSLRRATSCFWGSCRCHRHFYPRSPCGERPNLYSADELVVDFYPRSPCGERLPHPGYKRRPANFYPRSPCGERPKCGKAPPMPPHNFYPRSPCGERLPDNVQECRERIISIHALLAESDGICGQGRAVLCGISIHALLAESDAGPAGPGTSGPDFYPRSPCGERPGPRFGCAGQLVISIHALLAESDGHGYTGHRWVLISIHALLAESDDAGNQRMLRGCLFLSTLSLRRATGNIAPDSAHQCHFYPRSPCGERPPCPRCSRGTLPISIHALLAESDGKHRAKWFVAKISIHALLAESD